MSKEAVKGTLTFQQRMKFEQYLDLKSCVTNVMVENMGEEQFSEYLKHDNARKIAHHLVDLIKPKRVLVDDEMYTSTYQAKIYAYTEEELRNLLAEFGNDLIQEVMFK